VDWYTVRPVAASSSRRLSPAFWRASFKPASLIVAVLAFVVVGTSAGAFVLGAVFILQGERALESLPRIGERMRRARVLRVAQELEDLRARTGKAWPELCGTKEGRVLEERYQREMALVWEASTEQRRRILLEEKEKLEEGERRRGAFESPSLWKMEE
jgi:hypothetical protein